VAAYETAIVRLCGWAPGRPTAGLGLLVDDGRVVTCAHVVNAALGRGLREQLPPGESDLVQVEFPLLPKTPVRLARVVTWVPPPGQVGGGDIAGLLLSEAAPSDAASARFTVAGPEPGAPLRVFGYPGSPARGNGMWVDVDLKGEVGGQLIQVESRSDQTVKAQPGYSGSPVWDRTTGEAAGLLQVAPFADAPERDAYLLPPLAIASAWDEPFDYLLVPENPYRGLDPFTAEQSALFFGRDADVAALTEPGCGRKDWGRSRGSCGAKTVRCWSWSTSSKSCWRPANTRIRTCSMCCCRHRKQPTPPSAWS
jgi:trypsin-like peptidase